MKKSILLIVLMLLNLNTEIFCQTKNDSIVWYTKEENRQIKQTIESLKEEKDSIESVLVTKDSVANEMSKMLVNKHIKWRDMAIKHDSLQHLINDMNLKPKKKRKKQNKPFRNFVLSILGFAIAVAILIA